MTVQPPEFAALQRYIDTWGLPTIEQRTGRRLQSTLAELREFHDAVLPHLPAIIEFLNRFPVENIPQEFQPLAWTALSMIEVDDSINKWRSVTLDDALDPRRFTFKKSFYDTRPPGEQR